MSQTFFFPFDKYQRETMWRRKYLFDSHFFCVGGSVQDHLDSELYAWGEVELCCVWSLCQKLITDNQEARRRQEKARRQDVHFHGLSSMMPLYYKSINGLCHWLGQSPQVSLEVYLHTYPEMRFTSFLGIPRFSQVDSQDWPPQMWYRGSLASGNYSSGQSREEAHDHAL